MKEKTNTELMDEEIQKKKGSDRLHDEAHSLA